MLVKITRKGQVTIPAEVRERLGLKEGDVLNVDEKGGSVVFTPPLTIVERLYGIFHDYIDPKRPLDDDAMEEIMAEHALDEYAKLALQVDEEGARRRAG